MAAHHLLAHIEFFLPLSLFLSRVTKQTRRCLVFFSFTFVCTIDFESEIEKVRRERKNEMEMAMGVCSRILYCKKVQTASE